MKFIGFQVRIGYYNNHLSNYITLPRESWIRQEKFFPPSKEIKKIKSAICQCGISYVKEPVLTVE